MFEMRDHLARAGLPRGVVAMTRLAAVRKLARFQRDIERALYAIAKTPLRESIEDQSMLLQAWAKLEVERVNLIGAAVHGDRVGVELTVR